MLMSKPSCRHIVAVVLMYVLVHIHDEPRGTTSQRRLGITSWVHIHKMSAIFTRHLTRFATGLTPRPTPSQTTVSPTPGEERPFLYWVCTNVAGPYAKPDVISTDASRRECMVCGECGASNNSSGKALQVTVFFTGARRESPLLSCPTPPYSS